MLYKTEAVVPEYPGSSICGIIQKSAKQPVPELRSEQSKVILVTSSQPRDGKSFIAFNLAASIASVGYKTIILDCDLRRPTLHLKFKEDNTSGLSNLYGKIILPVDDIIHKTFIKNLSLYTCGPLIAKSF